MLNTNEISVKDYRKMVKKTPQPGKKHVVRADFTESVDPIEVIELYGYDPDTSFFIKGHVYSSKNSKQIRTRFPKKGQNTMWTCNNEAVIPFIADSDAVEAYRKAVWYVYKDLAHLFRDRVKDMPSPIVVQFTFIRMDNQGFDFPNIVQLVLDMMAYYKWVEDDEIKYILPVPPLPPKASHFISKTNAGVIITIL